MNNNKQLISPAKFQQTLLNWFAKHGRKNLPWQHNRTPYRVWISEIMLQQTQVNTVIAYFQRFIERFPDVKTLANAKEDEVLHLWTGLGYYQRARYLHQTAKIICDHYKEKFPCELSQLESLPGIGKSTAGAILSIAFSKSAPILDGNVKRVLTRLHGITEWPGEKKITETLWDIATLYTPQKNTADYTQAIMDLGATLCIRGKPTCDACPFNNYCIAYAKGIAARIPCPKPRKLLPTRTATFIIIFKKPHYVLLEKRSKSGVWKGLWSLPEIDGTCDSKVIRTQCGIRFSLSLGKIVLGNPFRHTFSHYHLDILPARVIIKDESSQIIDDSNYIWYNLKKAQSIGLPAPVKLLLSSLNT